MTAPRRGTPSLVNFLGANDVPANYRRDLCFFVEMSRRLKAFGSQLE